MPAHDEGLFFSDQLDDTLLSISADITARLASTKSLFEQLNTSQWNPNDVRVYRGLVEERRQLEMDHHKLSTRDVALRSGQRKATPADFGEPVETKFRYDNEYATYRYYGEHACVLEGVESCSHDLCRRAISEGLPYLEYDTIIHYDMRIAAAKTGRMKEALKKQRDVQLAKDIRDTEIWKDKCIKKMASFGKEANEAIIKAASRITGWQSSADDIELIPDTPIEQVGRALSDIRAKTMTAEQRAFGNACLSRIRTHGLGGLWWKLPSQYIEYLSPIQIDHLEASIANLQRVFSMNAMLYYEPHSCLRQFLKDFRDLIRWMELPHRKMYTGSTVGELLDEIKLALSMDDMRTGSDRSGDEESQYSDAPRSALHKVLKECLDLEHRAQRQMWRIQDQSIYCESSPDSGLAEVKRKCIQESSMPAITKLAVGRLEVMNREYRAVGALLAKANTGASVQELVTASMQHVWKIIGKDWMKLMSTCSNLKAALAARRRDATDKVGNETAFERLSQAFNEVEKEVHILDAQYSVIYDEDLRTIGKDIQGCSEPLIEQTLCETTDLYLLPGMLHETFEEQTHIAIARCVAGFADVNSPDLPRKVWQEALRQSMSRGVGDAFRVFQCVRKRQSSAKDKSLLRSLLHHSHQTTETLFRNSDGLWLFLYNQYQSGRCLPSAFARLLAALTNVSVFNPQTANAILQELSMVSNSLTKKHIPAVWEVGLQTLSRIFLQVYGYVTIEAMYSLRRADTEQVALSVVFLLAFGILLAKSTEIAKLNLEFSISFLEELFSPPSLDITTSCLTHIKVLLQDFISNEVSRCCGVESCTEPTLPTVSPFEPLSMDEQPQISDDSRSEPVPSPGIMVHAKVRQGNSALSMLRRHKQALFDILSVDIRKLSQLEKYKVLKYCAYQVKLLGRTAEHGKLGFRVNKLDQEMVDLLWQAFLRVEEVEYLDRPSSLNIGMHNHCNIWELVDSRDKTKVCGFMDGYRLRYRSERDLVKLAHSCKEYAITNGKDDPISAFDRRHKKLQKFAGKLPEPFEGYMLEQRDDLEGLFLENATKLRATYYWLEYLYHSDPNFHQLDTQYILAMLHMNEPQFMAFTDALRTEIAGNDGHEAAVLFSNSVNALLGLVKSVKPILTENKDLKKIHLAACTAWARSSYKDMIFSDDEDDRQNEDKRSCPTKESKQPSKLEKKSNEVECSSDHGSIYQEAASFSTTHVSQTPEQPPVGQSDIFNEETSDFSGTESSTCASNESPDEHPPQSTVQTHVDPTSPIISTSADAVISKSKTRAVSNGDIDNSGPEDQCIDRAEPKPTLLHSQILALKQSLNVTKSALSVDVDVGADPAAKLVLFQHLKYKAELAELQCDYMLRVLADSTNEQEDGRDMQAQQTLRKIEDLNRRMKALEQSECGGVVPGK